MSVGENIRRKLLIFMAGMEAGESIEQHVEVKRVWFDRDGNPCIEH